MIGRLAGALALAATAPTLLAQNLSCTDISSVPPMPNVRFESDVPLQPTTARRPGFTLDQDIGVYWKGPIGPDRQAPAKTSGNLGFGVPEKLP